MENKYITTKEALKLCQEAGLGRDGKGICTVTLLRIVRERGLVKQPAGKRGECFIDREGFKNFLKETIA
jgi:hypothetical protein